MTHFTQFNVFPQFINNIFFQSSDVQSFFSNNIYFDIYLCVYYLAKLISEFGD